MLTAKYHKHYSLISNTDMIILNLHAMKTSSNSIYTDSPHKMSTKTHNKSLLW